MSVRQDLAVQSMLVNRTASLIAIASIPMSTATSDQYVCVHVVSSRARRLHGTHHAHSAAPCDLAPDLPLRSDPPCSALGSHHELRYFRLGISFSHSETTRRSLTTWLRFLRRLRDIANHFTLSLPITSGRHTLLTTWPLTPISPLRELLPQPLVIAGPIGSSCSPVEVRCASSTWDCGL